MANAVAFSRALFGTYTAVFPRVQAFAVGKPHERSMLAKHHPGPPSPSSEETRQTSADPDISAMLAKPVQCPAAPRGFRS